MTDSKLPTTDHTDYVQQLRDRSRVAAAEGCDYTLLKCSQKGFWCFGEDDLDVQEGSKWAINPASFATGFIAWNAKTGDRLGDVLATFSEPVIDPLTLDNVGAPWKPQYGFQLKCLNGDDAGQEVLYKAGSVGARKAFVKITNEVLKRHEAGEADCVPVVELTLDSYAHKLADSGVVYNPVFNIVEWRNINDTATGDEPEPEKEPEPEPEPTPRKRRPIASEKAAPEQSEEAVATRPARRPRRRVA